jgi:hypothetical protein
MPIFKSTKNILHVYEEDEVFNENWMDSDQLILPEKVFWDYSREMKIEDVDIWEVIYESGGGVGLYASWSPYAEFYLVSYGLDYSINQIVNGRNQNPKIYETFYGKGSQEIVKNIFSSMGINLKNNKFWVEPEDMWLYI